MMSSQEDCFHLGAKALIQNGEGRLLLLQQTPKKGKEARWDIPGGRMQRNESLESTLKREVYEETGLEISSMHPLMMVLTDIRIPMQSSDVGLIFSVYLSTIRDPSPIQLSHEHIHFEWVEPNRAALLLDHYPPNLLEEIRKLYVI